MQKTIVSCLAVMFGLCGTAMAKPDWERHERSLPGLRSEIRQRMDVDGRANLHEAGVTRAERPAANKTRPSDFLPHPTMSQLPLKTAITMKIQGEPLADDANVTRNQQQSVLGPEDTRPSDYKQHPTLAQLPLKTAITMKMHGGEGAADDENASHSQGNNPGSTVAKKDNKDQGPTNGVKVNGVNRPMSRAEKETLCKIAGVCMPLETSSDDPADKTE